MGGLALGPLGPENPHTHSQRMSCVCVCEKEKLIEKDFNIYCRCKIEKGKRRG